MLFNFFFSKKIGRVINRLERNKNVCVSVFFMILVVEEERDRKDLLGEQVGERQDL